MIYHAVDLGKYPKTHTWHILYKMNQDEKCPYINIRIIAGKMTFKKQPITVQILDFAPTLPTHERNIILSRLKVLGEAILQVPTIAKT